MNISPDTEQPETRLPVDQATKDLLRKYFEIWNDIENTDQTTALANEVVHPDFQGRFETGLRGPQQLLAIARKRRQAFSGSRFMVDYDGMYKNARDEIVVPYIFVGTYRGTFLGEQAHGKPPIAMHGTAFYRVKDGKLLGVGSERNEQEMFEQLNVPRPTGETDEF